MKIVFIGMYDTANTCNRITRAINSCKKEMTARTITKTRHPFGYPEDIVIDRDGDAQVKYLLREADWIIQVGDGNYEYFDKCITGLTNKKIGVFHAGNPYRMRQSYSEDEDAKRGFLRRFLACDLYRFATEDPAARIYVQPMDVIASEVPELPGPLRICHTPSIRKHKGTKLLLEAVPDITVIEGVSYKECLRQRSKHHVLCDQFVPHIGGFGAAALEALSTGMAVISDVNKVTPLIERWTVPEPCGGHVEMQS